MAQITEAVCLLRSGAQYPLRRGFRDSAGNDLFVGIKPGAFSIYFGDAPIYHFDLEGRWQRAFLDGCHYLKSLDNSVVAIDRVREGENLVLKRRALRFAEASDLDEQVRRMAVDLIVGLGTDLVPVDPPADSKPLPREMIRDLLDAVAGWDAAAWFAHRERYLGTYGPLPFLPPDSTNSIILQSTLGRSSGPGFGGASPSSYHERSPVEFVEHATTVARLLGKRMAQYRQVFLAGPDALRRPTEAILADLEAIGSVFGVDAAAGRGRPDRDDVLQAAPRLGGVHTFLDRFDRRPFEQEIWQELRSRHLNRLIFGLESGSARVRQLYGSDGPVEGLRAWLGACPVATGLVVLVGAGGEEGRSEHLDETVRLVETLEIRPGSLVTLVDADVLEARPADLRRFELLDPDALAAQRSELKARLGAILGPRKVKVTTYSPEKQWQ